MPDDLQNPVRLEYAGDWLITQGMKLYSAITGFRFGIAALVFVQALPCGVSAANWEKIAADGTPPSERRGVRGVHDPVNDRFVFHGGETPRVQFLPDTWFFDLATSTWSQPAISNPSGRCHHTFLSDPERNRGLVFGGFPRNNQLWEYSIENAVWNEITPTPNPLSARCLHAAVLCEDRNEMIIYGGLNGGGTPDLNDTWSYNLTNGTWQAIEATVNPGFRYGAVAELDAVRDRILLFGGWHFSGQTIEEANDLWEFDLEQRVWRPVQTGDDKPSPRQFARSVLLKNSQGLLLFGGLSNGVFYNDLWFLDFATLKWEQIETGGTPPAGRHRHTLILDAELNFYVMFGEGAQRAHFNDVWKIDLAQSLYDSGAVRVEIARDPGSVAVQWMPRDRTFLADRFNGILPVYQVYRSPDLNTWEAIGDPVDANMFQPAWHYSVVDQNPAGNKFYQVRAVFAE